MLGRGEQQAADTAAARGGGDHDLLQLVGLDDQDAEEIVAVDGHGDVVDQVAGPRREVRRVPRLDQCVGDVTAVAVVPCRLPDLGDGGGVRGLRGAESDHDQSHIATDLGRM